MRTVTLLRNGVATVVLLLSMFVSRSAAAIGDITVTVRVRTTGGEPVAGAYVALVPVWRPSSRPLAEEVADKGVSVLRVLPGTYRLIAGARGYAVSQQGPIAVSEKGGTELAIALPALKSAGGTVTNDAGNPVAGARIATVNGAIPAPLGTLSELAVRHLAADWSTTTDERGRWELRLPEGAVPLLFEAAGRAAEWRIRPADDAATLDVSLSKGAMLQVTTDRVDRDLILTLSREDSKAAEGVVAAEDPRVWARWTKTNLLTWSSLPPGVYGVYAKYPDPRYFMQTAAKLATVTLAPDEEKAVQVVLPALRRPVTTSTAMFVRGISRANLGEGLAVFGRNATGNRQRAEHFVEEVTGGSVVHVKTEDLLPPFHAVTADRFFSTIPDVAEARQDVNAEPWPAAVLPRADAHLHLRFVEKDLQAPHAGVAVLRNCDKADRITVPIEIRADNLARFTAAAGCQSTVLEFEPFEPVVTGTVLLPGDQSLGEYTLRGAGSADVHVVRGPGGTLVADATVRAISDELGGGRAVVVKEGVTNDRGWTLLSGLPAHSSLRVIAETPEGDKSDPAALRLRPREHGLIDPLTITEPAVLVVDTRIDEAFLARFPAARIVTLLVRPADPDRHAERRQENTPKTGDTSTRFERLHAGKWLVSGAVSVAGTYSVVEIAAVELKTGETRHVEATIAPNVFEGVITSNGKGVAARVIIQDRGRTLYFNSDAAGMFHAVLENRGTYRVAAARLSAQANVIPIGNVAFTDPSRRIEIAIPPTGGVKVRVRLGERPVPGALVWVSRRTDAGVVEQLTRRVRTTNVNGDATFDDLAPGAWTIAAHDKENRRGAEETITVSGGKSVPVDLELAGSAAIEGIIRDLGGSPLPRARVDCLFVGSTGRADRASTDSDTEGAFAIDLPAAAPRSVLCGVIGPLGTVDAFKSTPGQPVELTVSGATATLRISDWAEYANPEMVWLVASDGRIISLNTVAMKLGRFGAPLIIPALAAGRWRVVRIDSVPQWSTLAGGMGVSLPALAEITLRAGTTETIQLNAIPAH